MPYRPSTRRPIHGTITRTHEPTFGLDLTHMTTTLRTIPTDPAFNETMMEAFGPGMVALITRASSPLHTNWSAWVGSPERTTYLVLGTSFMDLCANIAAIIWETVNSDHETALCLVLCEVVCERYLTVDELHIYTETSLHMCEDCLDRVPAYLHHQPSPRTSR
jgi:hypothetical protein